MLRYSQPKIWHRGIKEEESESGKEERKRRNGEGGGGGRRGRERDASQCPEKEMGRGVIFTLGRSKENFQASLTGPKFFCVASLLYL